MTFEEVYNTLLESAEAKVPIYDLSVDSAVLYIESQKNFFETVSTNIMLEYNIFDFKDDVVDVFNTKNIFVAIGKLLTALSKLLGRVVEIIFGITKKFIASARDASLGNEEFLKKYKPKISQLYGRDSIVRMDGYNANISDLAEIAKFANDSVISCYEQFMKLTEAEQNLELQEIDIYRNYLIDNRNKILKALGYRSKYNIDVTDTTFTTALNNALYGPYQKRVYDAHDALAIIEKYEDISGVIKTLNISASKTLTKEKKEIEILKRKFETGGAAPTSDEKALVRQCVLISNYTQNATNDVILTINVMIEYLNKINFQSKQVCVKALQQIS